MKVLETYFSGPLAEALGWTIVHSLWQAVLIGLVALLILRLRRDATAQFRYQAGILSLAAIFIASVFTFYLSFQPAGAVTNLPSLEDTLNRSWQAGNGLGSGPESLSLQQRVVSYIPWMISIWLAGVMIFSGRLAGGLFLVHRLRTRDVSPLSRQIEKSLRSLAEKAGIRRTIRFLLSTRITVPMAAGFIKPVILIPAGIISQMPPEQLEAVIAHEIAHIRRYDFIINILQSVMEALFFYHPVVWMLSSLIRQEREKCCDDFAVSAGRKLSTYAKALAGLGEFQAGIPSPALALNGNKKKLVNRVERLINPTKMKNNASEKIIAGLLIIGSALILTISTGASPSLKFNLTSLEKAGISGPAGQEIGADSAGPLSKTVPTISTLGSEASEPEKPEPGAAPAVPEELAEAANLAEPTEPSFPVSIANPAHLVEHDSLHKCEKIDIKDNVVTRDFIRDGEETNMKMTIRKGKVEELYVDGKKVPESEYPVYQKEIDRTLKDLKHMHKDLKHARIELENIDFEKIHHEIQEKMKHFQEHEMQEIQERMQHFRQHEMQEIQEQMKQFQQQQLDIQIDREKIQKELQEAMKEIQINKEKIQKEMQKVHEEIKRQLEENESGRSELSEEEQREMQEALTKAMAELEEINHEEIRAQIEHEMRALQESVDHEKIQKEIEMAMKELDHEQIQREVEMAMKEVDFQKIQHEMQEAIANLEIEKINMEEEKVKLDEMVRELEKLELEEE